MIHQSAIYQITKFMGSTWGPPGSCRPQVGPTLAPWSSYVSGYFIRCTYQGNQPIIQPLLSDCCLWWPHIACRISYYQISWNPEGARSNFRISISLCKLTDDTATMLRNRLSKKCENVKIHLHDFEIWGYLTQRALIVFWNGAPWPREEVTMHWIKIKVNM